MVKLGRKFENTNLVEWAHDKNGAGMSFVSKDEAVGYLRTHEVPDETISTLVFFDDFNQCYV